MTARYGFRNGPPAKPAIPENPEPWYKVQNKAGSPAADVWIYAEIGAWGITAEGLVSELSALNVSDITVHLNSPGGDVFDGIAIMNALRDHPAQITVKVDALAASIASVIAQAGNKIIMGRNSTMMIHNASGFAMGEAADLRKMADLLEGTTANIASIYAERAGGDVAGWLAVMDKETWYTAQEAVDAGLADEVAPLPTESAAAKQAASFDLSIYNHAPTLTAPAIEPEPQPGVFADLFRSAVQDATTPEPVPAFDPDLFRAAIQIVAQDTPAPPPSTIPEPAPVAGIDPLAFAQAIREARR
jgi:ATP-dependent protease ClpP protease subunit